MDFVTVRSFYVDSNFFGKIFILIFTKIVEKCSILGYNKCNDLGCAITPVILNLQNFKRDSYISVICQAFHVWQRKTKKRMRTPTWLRLGVKIQEPAFWGFHQR